VPGAIMPPPVDLQIEQESDAHPAWDAPAVLSTASEAVRGGHTFGRLELRAKGNGEEWGVPEPGICVWTDTHLGWQWASGPRKHALARAVIECETLETSRAHWWSMDPPDRGGSMPSDRRG
jgi:hypothetical protein